MFDYYKAWDKFTKETDDDNNDLNDFEEAKNPTPVPDKVCNTQAEMMQRTSGAKPGTKMVIKGGTVKQNNMADTLKQQGNAYFIGMDYEKAIDCYTRCIPHIPDSNHELRTIAYSNRAQCNIKIKRYE